MTTNGSTPPAALKMAAAIEDSLERGGQGSRDAFYFRESGKPLVAGGRKFGFDLDRRMKATFIIEYPYRPSLASLADMVAEHTETGGCVTYDTDRWNADKRVDEQIAAIAGDDVATDWKLERLLNELEEREEIAA